jgi:lincosamide nucleotidyltransferase A/C/D/E
MMTADDVMEVLDRLEASGVRLWLDGGWGVDALLGRTTRAHEDLEVVVTRAELPAVRAALAPLGYEHATDVEPGLPARFVLRDRKGRQVDCHPVVFDREGNAYQELGDGAWGAYPAHGLAGEGQIGGRRVPCTTAELQLRHHLGYQPTPRDRADVQALAKRFRLAVPPPYAT